MFIVIQRENSSTYVHSRYTGYTRPSGWESKCWFTVVRFAHDLEIACKVAASLCYRESYSRVNGGYSSSTKVFKKEDVERYYETSGGFEELWYESRLEIGAG